MAYGLERGGINIEHGTQNRITHNEFTANKCGIHLWDDPDEDLLKKPWTLANHKGCTDNQIIANRFERNTVAIQFRQAKSTLLQGNHFAGNTKDIDADAESQSQLIREAAADLKAPSYEALGSSRPVGARPHPWPGPTRGSGESTLSTAGLDRPSSQECRYHPHPDPQAAQNATIAIKGSLRPHSTHGQAPNPGKTNTIDSATRVQLDMNTTVPPNPSTHHNDPYRCDVELPQPYRQAIAVCCG